MKWFIHCKNEDILIRIRKEIDAINESVRKLLQTTDTANYVTHSDLCRILSDVEDLQLWRAKMQSYLITEKKGESKLTKFGRYLRAKI